MLLAARYDKIAGSSCATERSEQVVSFFFKQLNPVISMAANAIIITSFFIAAFIFFCEYTVKDLLKRVKAARKKAYLLITGYSGILLLFL